MPQPLCLPGLRYSHLVWCALSAMVLLAGCGGKYARQIKNIQSADVKAAVAAAVSKGDFRFIGFVGPGLYVPGVPDYLAEYADKYGMRSIENVSDNIDSDEQARLNQAAHDYAKRYNALLLTKLPAAPSTEPAPTNQAPAAPGTPPNEKPEGTGTAEPDENSAALDKYLLAVLPPDQKDKEFAATLEPIILKAAFDYMRGQTPSLTEKNLAVAGIVAARPIHDYILLDIQDDGMRNRHLIYSTKSKRIVRRFSWYVQR